VEETRQRTFELVEDLKDDQMMGPRLAIVNPLLWEIGHQAWFQEKWVLRHAAHRQPIRPDADALYDSAAVPHDTRWDLPLPSRDETLRYMTTVRDRVLERILKREPSPEEIYFVLLSVFHEDMHTEAITYTRQTLGYPPPRLRNDEGGMMNDEMKKGAVGISSLLIHHSSLSNGPLPGDVQFPGGTFWLGATPDEPFVFDNEKWAHPVDIQPFAMARAPVTQQEFAAFADDGGYRDRRFWSESGWRWREEAAAEHPVYWQREPGGRWLRRDFDCWLPLEPHRPIIHVNWYEAEAYCGWAGRRLPTEPEWEAAASQLRIEDRESRIEERKSRIEDGGLRNEKEIDGSGDPRSSILDPHSSDGAGGKRRFPWGDESPTPRHANLDWRAMGCVDVADFPEGDSALGCRQMIGNVWEWTASDFLPYPGFTADPYKEYSAPWFGTHKVLRGGCWTTRSRLLRNTWRNFYRPERRDVWAGFRTCAL
jgi:iron(II)-dependent oxidoreductase